MGLECVDILSTLLEKDMKHILTRILSRLEDTDLISCEKVCKMWRTIICQEKSAFKCCREAQQRIKVREPKPTGSYSRDFAPSRVVFSYVQPVTSTPVSTPSRAALRMGNKVDFWLNVLTGFAFPPQAAATLKQDEGLRCCRQCSFPACYDSAMKQAVCTRASCTYDFCTLCLGAFHGSESCRAGVLGSFSSESHCTPLPCSKQSKRNIRRL
ncbi:hypothetical protein ACEWY4_010066 [Coilia grayii]|uniref:ZBR-type domain-containing protein n=1 Tax=Coilia grayii TaxID=363190 RepID=A0ABD1K877_9TELE